MPDWNSENAAHLLRRAGFGATAKDVSKAVKQGFDKTLDGLLKTDKGLPQPSQAAYSSLENLQAWWLRRLRLGKRPLVDKLSLFWHNHFATANSKVSDLERMHVHVATLRAHALGNFRELLLAVSRDPAMLIWLDNKSNYAGSINENFARELMELFTTGVYDKAGAPNYTEADVVEVARAFTGWSLSDGEFAFKDAKHDHGTKSFKGLTGDLDGTDVIERLFLDPATAQRLAMKLFSCFAYPIALDDPLADELAAVYLAGGGELAPLVEAIFRHDAFWSPQARRAVVRSPADWMVSSLRTLGVRIRHGVPWELGHAIGKLGQALYNPPSVFGWDEGLAWVGSGGLLERAVRAEWIADARGKGHDLAWKPAKLLGPKKAWKDLDAAGVVAAVLAALDLPDASPATVAALVSYAAADDAGDPQPVVVDAEWIDRKLRGLVSLVLASPEWQLA